MKAYLGSCFFSLPGATEIGKTPQNSALAGVSNDFKQAHSYDYGDKFGQTWDMFSAVRFAPLFHAELRPFF
jgi:hypothetical protein